MKPVLFWLGDVPIGSWPVFVAIAFLFAFFVFKWCCSLHPSCVERFNGPGSIERFAVFLYVAGLLGSRFLGGLYSDSPHEFLGGPMTFFGGLLAATLCGWLWLWLQRIPVSEILDRAVPALLVGLGIGRLGCLLNGDDYGRSFTEVGIESSFLWHSWTMMGSGPGATQIRYATQLQEAIASFALAFMAICMLVLRGSSRRPFQYLRPGQIGLLALMLSLLNRFWNEFFRGDERPFFFDTHLSQAQGIAVVGFSISFILFVSLFLRSASVNPQDRS